MSARYDELEKEIERALARELKIWEINVEVTDDNVFLQGAVRDRGEYARAMETARRMAGKRVVKDQDLVVEAQPMDLS